MHVQLMPDGERDNVLASEPADLVAMAATAMACGVSCRRARVASSRSWLMQSNITATASVA